MSQLVSKWNVFPPKLTMRFLLVCLFVCSVFIIVNLDGNNPLMLTSCATVCFNKFCSTWDFHPQFSQKSPQFSPLCPWASLYNDLDEILSFLHFVLTIMHVPFYLFPGIVNIFFIGFLYPIFYIVARINIDSTTPLGISYYASSLWSQRRYSRD